jgi:hypothetical protein
MRAAIGGLDSSGKQGILLKGSGGKWQHLEIA